MAGTYQFNPEQLVPIKERLEADLKFHVEYVEKIKAALAALDTPGLAELIDLIRR